MLTLIWPFGIFNSDLKREFYEDFHHANTGNWIYHQKTEVLSNYVVCWGPQWNTFVMCIIPFCWAMNEAKRVHEWSHVCEFHNHNLYQILKIWLQHWRARDAQTIFTTVVLNCHVIHNSIEEEEKEEEGNSARLVDEEEEDQWQHLANYAVILPVIATADAGHNEWRNRDGLVELHEWNQFNSEAQALLACLYVTYLMG